MLEAISDTSPLQYLYQAESLDLLRVLYERVLVPEAVLAELAEGRALGVALPDPLTISWMTATRAEERRLFPLITDLGAGEREVLALGLERQDALLLLDDALARRYARLLGLTFTGTLGVILEAEQVGHVPRVEPILRRLESLRFRLHPATREAVLRLAGEVEG
jgi:hypothetical protein